MSGQVSGEVSRLVSRQVRSGGQAGVLEVSGLVSVEVSGLVSGQVWALWHSEGDRTLPFGEVLPERDLGTGETAIGQCGVGEVLR